MKNHTVQVPHRVLTIAQHKDYPLRFMAVSAPHWKSSGSTQETYSLDSRIPFSLQNAVRLGAKAALKKELTWGQSNWSDKDLLSESVFILNYHDEEVSYFIKKLDEIKPHVLFLGTMTLSFPGAISLATIAKEKMGPELIIILGGKHINETVYKKDKSVCHHVGSPLRLMLSNKIPRVFDLIVSGDGEEAIKTIGNSIGKKILTSNSKEQYDYKRWLKNTRGKFIASWIEDESIQNYISKQIPLDYTTLPSPVSLFGTSIRFPIFGTDKTAHVYSDTGKGCIFNCFFCSERSTVNGKVTMRDSPARLYNQLKDACQESSSMSAFIEDSILLMGNPQYLEKFADLLEEKPLPVIFGGQFTIDLLNEPTVRQAIQRLKKYGLQYIYIGMETANEEVATSMSKNTHKETGWISRHIEVITFLSSIKISCGVSVLWGLGETQDDRLHQLSMLKQWQDTLDNPVVVSLNWATQHPLFNMSSFDYVEWGTNLDSPYLPILTKLFGEASEKYTMHTLPTIEEFKDLEEKFFSLHVVNT